MDTALQIDRLCYTYKSNWMGRNPAALKEISLTVQAGECFGFLGHNGAGKTTTIKCILNLITPTAGSIRIAGKPSTDPSARRAVGYLPEQPYFYDHLSVRELLMVYAKLVGIPSPAITGEVDRVLDRVGVAGRASSPMRTLSKGLTQRVAMAQAILGRPQLLVLDEPFSGLDPLGRREFRKLLFELKESGTTIFVSSHILGDVEHLCDRASILGHGELKAVFNMKDVPELAGSLFELVILGEESAVTAIAAKALKHETQGELHRVEFSDRSCAEAALRDALAARLSVQSFQYRQGGLEELFVQLVNFDEAKERP